MRIAGPWPLARPNSSKIWVTRSHSLQKNEPLPQPARPCLVIEYPLRSKVRDILPPRRGVPSGHQEPGQSRGVVVHPGSKRRWWRPMGYQRTCKRTEQNQHSEVGRFGHGSIQLVGSLPAFQQSHTRCRGNRFFHWNMTSIASLCSPTTFPGGKTQLQKSHKGITQDTAPVLLTLVSSQPFNSPAPQPGFAQLRDVEEPAFAAADRRQFQGPH